MGRVRRVIEEGTAFYEREIEADPEIHLYRERAVFTSATTLQAGEHEIEFRHALLAPGADPAIPDVPGANLPAVVTSDELLKATALPEHLICIGAGAVGLEFAQAYRRLGARVTVLQRGEHIAKGEDPELADLLADYLRDEGVDVHVRRGASIASRRGQGASLFTRATAPRSTATVFS